MVEALWETNSHAKTTHLWPTQCKHENQGRSQILLRRYDQMTLQERMHDVKNCETNAHSNWAFDPVQTQPLIEASAESFSSINICQCGQHVSVLGIWCSVYSVRLHSSPNDFQRIRQRLSKQSRACSVGQPVDRAGGLVWVSVVINFLERLVNEEASACIRDDAHDSWDEATVKR